MASCSGRGYSLDAEVVCPAHQVANDSFAKGYNLEITDELYAKSYNLLEKILCGNKSLTKQEIAEHFCCSGILVEADNHR